MWKQTHRQIPRAGKYSRTKLEDSILKVKTFVALNSQESNTQQSFNYLCCNHGDAERVAIDTDPSPPFYTSCCHLEKVSVTCPDVCIHLREPPPQPAGPAQHLSHTKRWLPPAWQVSHDNDKWTQKESAGQGLGLSLEPYEAVALHLPNVVVI